MNCCRGSTGACGDTQQRPLLKMFGAFVVRITGPEHRICKVTTLMDFNGRLSTGVWCKLGAQGDHAHQDTRTLRADSPKPWKAPRDQI